MTPAAAQGRGLICYRRRTSDRLAEELRAELGLALPGWHFQLYDWDPDADLVTGASVIAGPFRIEDLLGSTDVVLLLIENGRTEAGGAESWPVLAELFASRGAFRRAHQRDMRLLPVLVDGDNARLPPALVALATDEAMPLRRSRFRNDVADLATTIAGTRPRPVPPPPPQKAFGGVSLGLFVGLPMIVAGAGSWFTLATIRPSEQDGVRRAQEEAARRLVQEAQKRTELDVGRIAQEEARRLAQAEARRRALEAAGQLTTGEFVQASHTPLAELEWPPPHFSTYVEIPRNLLLPDPALPATLGGAARRLQQALSRAGHEQHSFLQVGLDGLALVTRVERLASDGAALPGTARFRPPDAVEPFSLLGFVKNLIAAEAGHYRLIMFTMTSRPLPATGRTIRSKEALELPKLGLATLPKPFADLPYTPEHHTFALIYEFEKDKTEATPVLLDPGRFTAMQHLQKAAIWAALQAATPTPGRVNP